MPSYTLQFQLCVDVKTSSSVNVHVRVLNLCVNIDADLQVIDDTKHSAPCFAARPVMIRLPDRDACLEVMVLMYHAKDQGVLAAC